MTHNLADLEEIDRFGEAVDAYLAGDYDAERFTATRLQMGVYGQRQEGVHMVRVKLPGGRVSPRQLGGIATAVEQYSEQDYVHITTRQDIQLHYVPTRHTPAVLRLLADVGLTTREACGNTVRNVTACPLAGVCTREHTDVTRHVDGVVAHFLRNPLNQQLPRKFKVSFSGCEADCAQGMIHDLGVVAVRDGARRGFKVLAGGGLGHKPHEAIVVEPFIAEDELLPVMEALVALHNRHSDRTKRAKSRMKFLVDRFGAEGFVARYREELARTREGLADRPRPRAEWREGAAGEAPGPGAPRRLTGQRQLGRYALPLAVPLGRIGAAQLRAIASLLQSHGLHELRTTQDQNLLVLHVPREKVGALYAGFARIGLRSPEAGDNVVACPGTSTCRLGITASTVLASALTGGADDLRIRVSGCHNGCAQPETGDIGLYGEARRLHGRLIPHYQTYFGGDGTGGGLALKGPSVPAARVAEAVARVKQAFADTRQAGEGFTAWVRRQPHGHFHGLLGDLAEVSALEAASLARDFGGGEDFRVLQLGGGECAAAPQLRVGAAFFEAAHERGYRDAFLNQRKAEDALGCARAMLRLVGGAVLEVLGGAPVENPTAVAADLQRLEPPGAGLASGYAALAAAFGDAGPPAEDRPLAQLFRELDRWTAAAGRFCAARQPKLDLPDALPGGAAAGDGAGIETANGHISVLHA